MSRVTTAVRRHAMALGLTMLISGAVLLAGCSAGTGSVSASAPELERLRSENAQLKDQVAGLQEEVQRLQGKLVAVTPMLEPISINYSSYPARYRLVLRDGAKLLAIPRDGALALMNVESGVVLEVLDAASADDTSLWLYVQAPVYSSPTNLKGWIRESDTVSLTRENRDQVRGDLYLKVGTPVYQGTEDFAAISQAHPTPLDGDARAGAPRCEPCTNCRGIS